MKTLAATSLTAMLEQEGPAILETISLYSMLVVKGSEKAVDLQMYDVEKCFDALWLQECINDIYEAGLHNDKLPLLFMENSNAKVAAKT